jgi:hypothetical protein
MDFGWGFLAEIMAATAALGTASFGLVDATKAARGGISNIGYGFVHEALQPFEPALKIINPGDPYAVTKANWLNGMDKSEQKVIAKGLVRLGTTEATAAALAAAVTNIDAAKLAAIAKKMNGGDTLAEDEITLLGRFDALVDARLDAAFERGDQKYRNVARFAAAAVAVVLAQVGMLVVVETPESQDYVRALLVGLVAVPLAPVAKDVASALSTAVAAYKSVKR